MVISMLKIRRPLGRLIFNMGIAIPGKTVFLIETAPRTPISGTPILVRAGLATVIPVLLIPAPIPGSWRICLRLLPLWRRLMIGILRRRFPFLTGDLHYGLYLVTFITRLLRIIQTGLLILLRVNRSKFLRRKRLWALQLLDLTQHSGQN